MNSKEELIQYGLKMKNDCLIKANWGNLNIRVPQGFIISPSGMNYEDISIEDIVTLNLSGEIVEGFRKPSSEYLLHLEIYNKYPNINAVMHTHSTYASAFAVTRKEIPSDY